MWIKNFNVFELVQSNGRTDRISLFVSVDMLFEWKNEKKCLTWEYNIISYDRETQILSTTTNNLKVNKSTNKHWINKWHFHIVLRYWVSWYFIDTNTQTSSLHRLMSVVVIYLLIQPMQNKIMFSEFLRNQLGCWWLYCRALFWKNIFSLFWLICSI